MTRLLAIALLAITSSCALLSKNEPVVFRYYTPERASPTTVAHDSTVVTRELRLGRVSAASYLKDQIAYRDSDYEVGFYDSLRWTERPEAYLRRAMARTLFEQHDIKQFVSGAGWTLEIELAVFEELRAPRHAGRVEVSWVLRDDHAVLVQKTIRVEKPIAAAPSSTEGSAVAGALSEALAEAVKIMTAAVVIELARP